MGTKKTNVTIQRVQTVMSCLKKIYPDAKCSLTFKNAYELLIATILSAQARDERVNQVTPALFKKYPHPTILAKAPLKDVEKLIKTIGFYRGKARSIVESAQIIVEKFGGQVPSNMESLIQLRGVGRKTANVILGNVFGVPGITVDTHVGRLSRRLGFTKHMDPVKVEHDLMAVVPKKEWTEYSHLLIFHGRARCMARKPDCAHCEVADICPKVGVMT